MQGGGGVKWLQSTQSALPEAGCLTVVNAGNIGFKRRAEVTAGKEEASGTEADRKTDETERKAGQEKYIIVVQRL